MNDAEKRAKKAAKEIKEARFVVRWSPVFWLVGLVLLGFALDRCLAKPGAVSCLRLLLPCGYCILVAGRLRQAKARLRDEDAGISRAYDLLGTILFFAGVNLPDMYRRGHGAAFGFFGSAFLVLLLMCGILLWLEHKEIRNKRSRLAALRAAANSPAPTIEPVP